MAKLELSQTILHSKAMPQVLHKNLSPKTSLIYRAINSSFILLELITIIGSFIVLYAYRLSIEFRKPLVLDSADLWNNPRTINYVLFLLIVIILWVVWSSHFKLFSSGWDISNGLIDESIRVLKAISYSVLLTVGIAFVFKLTDYSRLVVIGFWIISFAGTVGLRSLKRLITVFLIRQGILVKNVLIIGAGQVGKMVAAELSNKNGIGYNIIGYIDDEKSGTVDSYQVVGKIKDINRVVIHYPIDEIIITIPTEKHLINEVINKYRKFNFTIRIIPEMFNLVSKTIEVTQSNTFPFITLIKTPMRGSAFIIKRLIDFIFAFIALIVLSPVFLIVAVIIRLDSSGNVFYKQRRVGKNGDFFDMYKFRSMITSADEIQSKLLKKNEMHGPVFKMKDDPRVTRIGKFIRKYSIDELPQLINVLKGEMSLIGPRPPIPMEVDRYTDWDWRRLEVVPGITGLWQVSGRSNVAFEQWVNLDVYYIENWSLWLDCKILLKTIPVIMKGEGAY